MGKQLIFRRFLSLLTVIVMARALLLPPGNTVYADTSTFTATAQNWYTTKNK